MISGFRNSARFELICKMLVSVEVGAIWRSYEIESCLRRGIHDRLKNRDLRAENERYRTPKHQIERSGKSKGKELGKRWDVNFDSESRLLSARLYLR
jgi:hypothetical protein